MNTVTVRNVVIGAGVPKICAPITGSTREEILEQARTIRKLPVDLVEWRVDFLNNVSSLELRNELGETPLLFTFRTKREGGEKDISPQGYLELNRTIIASGLIDLVDVELFLGDDIVTRLVKDAHEHGVAVVASNHDFRKTPPREELLERLRKMQDLGADILKIAVMPKDTRDVLVLLAATETASKTLEQPVVTMSMGGKGVLSRVSGETFGSAITFGSAAEASAPGQLPVADLHKVLEELHRSIHQ